MKRTHRTPLGTILLIAASASFAAAPPSGSYSQTCRGMTVGADDVLKAQCKTKSGALVDTSLKLPCNGAIDNLNGKLTCVAAPVDPAFVALLKQWHGALEQKSGKHFLEAPNVTTPAALKKMLAQWHGALEQWHGNHFLQDPARLADSPTQAELLSLFQQWKGALESSQGSHFLIGVARMPNGTLATIK